ncbi:MAG: hypothetical protein KQI62_20440 [Deltaproteobacteria bacterium]|nr:hypothetical protein [Deltaproteobacteria bacterium]
MSNGENNQNLKKQITFIATVVGTCLIALIVLLGTIFRSDATPKVLNYLFNINQGVTEKVLEDPKVLALFERANQAEAKVNKLVQEARDIKKALGAQLKDVDTAYFKKFVFQNEPAAAGQPVDRGLHFFADGSQRVSVRFWCDRQTECGSTFFKIKIDQENLFKGEPYKSKINGWELTAKAENYLPASYIPPKGDMGSNMRTLTVVPDVSPDHDFKQRIELFCWVYVRHKGVACD